MKRIRLANRVVRLGYTLAAALIAAAWGSNGASAQTLNDLVTFSGSNGSIPEDVGNLIADAHGNLFGTTAYGGTSIGSSACPSSITAPYTDGCGTVFEIKFDSTTQTYASTPTTLVNFNGTDGAYPLGGLIADASGNLFGTTSAGGTSTACPGSPTSASGCGTVFEIKFDSTTQTYASTPTTLASADGADGAYPLVGLIADARGNLFGTTLVGGTSKYFGTVFELKFDSTTQTYTPISLVSFDGSTAGYPYHLIADASGNLFGTTQYGGGGQCYGGCGTMFEIKFDSTTQTYASTPTTLVSFNGADGAYPEGTLIADAQGNLFSTTAAGGASSGTSSPCPANMSLNLNTSGCGTVFELKFDSTTQTYASTPTTLVSFNGTDGVHPLAGLIADANGNLFGTTWGLPGGDGTVFEIKFDGTTRTYASTPTTLITFNAGDGAFPVATLIADANGNLFGTAYAGGATGDGVVFEVTGSGFVPPVLFAGTPGTPNCIGVSISTLAQAYGGIAHAAASLGYGSVMALQNAVRAYCRN